MIEIQKTNGNIRILRKILNSVAKKYDCGVRFYVHDNRLVYEGDSACAREIYSETMEIIHCPNKGYSTPMAA